jgi:hypothetical protein
MFSLFSPLLGFFVQSVLFAESAVLVHLKPVGVVFLIFDCIVIALFALGTSQSNFNSHDGTSSF